MMKLIFSTLYFFSILGAFAKLHADKIEVAGYQFSPPEKWVSTPPSSKMRKAQFTVLGKDEKNAEVAFFHFGAGGAGGVKANVDRWMSQFEDAQDQVVKNTVIGDIPVTYVQANGTFLSGRAFGPKTPKPNFALLAAIIEGGNGSIFIKMTGPKDTVEGQVSNLKKMILSTLDK